MNVTEAIYHLIALHKRITIPGLGALEHRTHPSEIHENRISAPVEELIFDPAQTSDTKKLQNYLADQNEITHTEAARIISDFVGDLNKAVISGKIFHFPGIGDLSLSEESQWTFKADADALFAFDFYGIDDIEIDPSFNASINPNTMKEIQEAPQSTEWEVWVVVDPENFFETKKEADKKNLLSYDNLHKVIQISETQGRSKGPVQGEWIVVDPDDFFETKERADKRNQFSYNLLHKVVNVVLDEPEEQKDQPSSSIGYTKIFLGILLLAVVAFGLNYLYPKIFGTKTEYNPSPAEVNAADSIFDSLVFKESPSMEETPVATPVINPEATLVTNPVATPVATSVPASAQTQGKPFQMENIPILTPDPKVKFYVVIASFETQRRAKPFIRQLAAQGIHADIVTYGESRYRIVTGGFSDEEVAQKSREAIKTMPMCGGAWILTNN